MIHRTKAQSNCSQTSCCFIFSCPDTLLLIQPGGTSTYCLCTWAANLFRGNTGVHGELLRAALIKGMQSLLVASVSQASERRCPPDAMSFTGLCAHLRWHPPASTALSLFTSSYSVGNLSIDPPQMRGWSNPSREYTANVLHPIPVWGLSLYQQAILCQQLGVLQFNLVLTLLT